MSDYTKMREIPDVNNEQPIKIEQKFKLQRKISKVKELLRSWDLNKKVFYDKMKN